MAWLQAHTMTPVQAHCIMFTLIILLSNSTPLDRSHCEWPSIQDGGEWCQSFCRRRRWRRKRRGRCLVSPGCFNRHQALSLTWPRETATAMTRMPNTMLRIARCRPWTPQRHSAILHGKYVVATSTTVWLFLSCKPEPERPCQESSVPKTPRYWIVGAGVGAAIDHDLGGSKVEYLR